MLNASSVEVHSLGAGVNEVPRSTATFCSTISVARRDGWYETGKRAPSGWLGEQDHQEPWMEFNQVVLWSRGGGERSLWQENKLKGKKIRRQMPVFKTGAGNRGHCIWPHRGFTLQWFSNILGEISIWHWSGSWLRCLLRKEIFHCSFWVPGLISVQMMAPFEWLKNCVESWWLCLLSSAVSLHLRAVLCRWKLGSSIAYWVCTHAHMRTRTRMHTL